MPAPATPRPAHPPAAGYAGYRTLRVWQRALDVAVDATHLARTLAAAGHEHAATDLPRAAAAVPAHIAAGSTAGSRADYHRALAAALAAVARVETMVAIAERLAPGATPACTALLANAADLTRQLRAFARVMSGAATVATSPPPRPAAAQSTAGASAPAVVPTPLVGEVVPEPTALEATTSEAAAPVSAPSAETVAAPMPIRPARARRIRPQAS